ncbi:MAG: metallopeptidase family protein [Phycisphaeraceae bacterium]|nr:MAG: metallopeptidase family protein [Phycisphaeraceae bacterium]
MNDRERARFDALMEEAIEDLPPSLRELIEEVPVIVLDRPTPEMLRSLGIPPDDTAAASELCGLHTGTALTERSVTRDDLPSDIHLFREGIIDLAGGFEGDGADDAVYEEIMVTLLHEIGHHFGLDEDDLERLGYD